MVGKRATDVREGRGQGGRSRRGVEEDRSPRIEPRVEWRGGRTVFTGSRTAWPRRSARLLYAAVRFVVEDALDLWPGDTEPGDDLLDRRPLVSHRDKLHGLFVRERTAWGRLYTPVRQGGETERGWCQRGPIEGYRSRGCAGRGRESGMTHDRAASVDRLLPGRGPRHSHRSVRDICRA